MALFAAALRGYARFRELQLARVLADPAAAQARQLGRLVQHAAQTAFGRAHGFARLRSPADFARAVPIRDYLAYAPWWARQLAGERNVTWPEPAFYYAKTSGTTAGDKAIPVTRQMLVNYRKAGLDIFVFLARRPRRLLYDLFAGQFLFLGGSTALRRRANATAIGDMSGILAHKIHWPINLPCEPSKDIALIGDWERKLDVLARTYVDRDIRGISGMPSWISVLFARMLELRGTRLRPGDTAALRRAGIWPNFQVLLHFGVQYAPFRPLMASYLPPETQAIEGYPASEGFFAIQADPADPGLQLCLDHGVFYEFVPVEELHRPAPRRLTLDQVELGVHYAVVISTCSGAFAYSLGDTVRFTSLRPPRIVITGRTAHFINAFGENVIVEHCDQALQAACAATGAELAEYTAGPVYPAPGRPARHEYAIEFLRLPPGGPEGLARFAEHADRALQRLNVDYATKRAGDAGMARLVVQPVPARTFYRWLAGRRQLGGQHKVPRCANHREHLDAVLALAAQADAQHNGHPGPTVAPPPADRSAALAATS